MMRPDVHSQRTRTLEGGGQSTQPPEGPVVYWMHHALRAHENPALDVALSFARQLDRPLLVYQGLSERYPFASDRHHTFALEGAVDVARELVERRIAYRFHLERPEDRRSHLLELAGSAAAVVTEDFPIEPFPSWTRRIANVCRGPVFAVDTACLAPMGVVGRAYERAFAFRKAARPIYREAVSLDHPESEFEPELPDDDIWRPAGALVPDRRSIPEWISSCDIDHAIGPVPHTRGGSAAGYARWVEFRDTRLRAYSRRRNDALDIDGVSRLSAYLHYGMVSPFRLAREAHATGGAGAEKFLDELLIWREMAYAYCFHRPDYESVETLPDWALDSLRSHEADPRPELFSHETLSRGRTGDPLWDAAQQSLLRHGELHNNVRMTWGKALLQWTSGPEEALAMLVDLNHRYALDGRDPASYGGILWCLGQFDRPFTPPKPIVGTVRPRSTRSHARRLDVGRYAELTARPLVEPAPRVAVVGGGLAGLFCARTLMDHGLSVRVFDKGRAPGGRMSSRRTAGGLSFDHGAQYFTARDANFRRSVESWRERGLVDRWRGEVARIEAGEPLAETEPRERFVGVPSMSVVCRHLAEECDVRRETRVERVVRRTGCWSLVDPSGEDLGAFDQIVVATPAPQAVDLLDAAPDLARIARTARMRPCIAVMLAFTERLDVPFDAAFVVNSPLGWIARDSSKPGRSEDLDVWILHATHEWSADAMERDEHRVVEELHDALFHAVSRDPIRATRTSLQRWRYALADEPLDRGCLFDAASGIGACGDWCVDGRIEGAFRSGAAMAGRILGTLAS